MKWYYGLPSVLMGVSIALLQPQAVTAICSNNQVDAIAKKITVLVLISGAKNGSGSGIIIQRNGNTYTVLTAYHVVKDPNSQYQIVTPDGQHYRVNYQTVKQPTNNIDSAVLQFTSNQNYPVAKIGNSDTVKRLTNIYLAGFPGKRGGVRVPPVYDCRDGQVIANATQTIVEDGYTLFHKSSARPGMSGGAVLNEQGEVIGIFGKGENPSFETVRGAGRNYSIPINTFIKLSAGVGVNLGISLPDVPNAGTPQADDYLVQADYKLHKRDYSGAIAAYNEVIRLNPNYAEALLYRNRGSSYYALGDTQAAIADFNEAIKINPDDAKAYAVRGIARYKLGDRRAAIRDFNEVIKINPDDARAYAGRGIARYELGDKQGAIADLKTAANLSAQQGNKKLYQKVSELLRIFQRYF
ncbi:MULTISPECIES: tetratricopeptide repeat-containing serine protease family protein [Nostocales]|uniref:tetratricopeptide repeat-containing S1 family peptidase n=1 Tax=Nostocales TaxID=1161 RepID=UPI00029B7108|nr:MULTISPECIES: tetratricopeptide repeat-containing serine protease family protein [Nostocales]AFW95522.1 TPR repeat-containing putative serine protease [Anabaena sp. 90]MTJ18568.1 serine protease [Dolichospermum sp. UHCC 0299]MTJ24046.1 serine protease [Dolichospermum sp. UHCC 0352]MTJ41196.1 serine protease [Dolichospermum sp. UHCC 0406]